MPKQGTRAEVNSFVQGLITEASPLNFPQNASFDEVNFELNRNGTRNRRLGMDLEDEYVFLPSNMNASTAANLGFSSFTWYSVAGDTSNEFLVNQIGNQLHIFDNSVSNLTEEGLIGVVDIPFSEFTRYSMASVDGKLVVAAGEETVAVITYNKDTNQFIQTTKRLLVRDLWGVQETIQKYEDDQTYRGPFSINHVYNLQNQSWGIPRRRAAGDLDDALSASNYREVDGLYPSNSEVVWTGLQFQPIVGTAAPYERIFSNLYAERFGAEILASKGYYIIDLLKRGTSRVEASQANYVKYPQIEVGNRVTVLPKDTTPGGASVLCEFAGRVFFGGFDGAIDGGDERSPVLANYITFSTLVRNITDINKCYQEGDPTSREGSDIVDTDGGFIRISGAKKIVALRNIGTHIVVLADNGIWTVTGGNNYAFAATSYKVDKLSAFGCISEASVVVEGGRVFFWSEDGIYVVAKDQYGDLKVNNITSTTIQTFYELIPNTVKENAVGIYDLYSKKVRWLYKDNDLFTSESDTKELILDTTINAFYKFKVYNHGGNGQEVMSMFVSAPFLKGSTFEPLFVGANPVVVNTDIVGQTTVIKSTGLQSVKYMVIRQEDNGKLSYSFSSYTNPSFRDWGSIDGIGVDAFAYMITGAQTAGDSGVAKQIPYLTMHFYRTEDGVGADGVPLKQSSCFLRSQWDWSNSPASSKWGKLMQVYRQRQAVFTTGLDDEYDTGFETVVSKSKLRGRGKAFSIYMETEPYKDCRVIGWNVTLNGNAIT